MIPAGGDSLLVNYIDYAWDIDSNGYIESRASGYVWLKFMWLRSPIVYDNVAYYVNTDGYAYYYNSFVVSNSCGNILYSN